MKQRITDSQLKQLSENAYDRLAHWCELNDYFPCLSIGQMLHLLMENGWTPEPVNLDMEVCDALWEEVKKILEG